MVLIFSHASSVIIGMEISGYFGEYAAHWICAVVIIPLAHSGLWPIQGCRTFWALEKFHKYQTLRSNNWPCLYFGSYSSVPNHWPLYSYFCCLNLTKLRTENWKKLKWISQLMVWRIHPPQPSPYMYFIALYTTLILLPLWSHPFPSHTEMDVV